MSCIVCNRKSDAARGLGKPGLELCGTHFDRWLKSHEYRRARHSQTPESAEYQLADFVRRLQAEARNEVMR